MLWLSEKYNYYRIKVLNQIYGHIKVSIYIYVHLKYFFRETENKFTLKLLTMLLSPILFLTIWSLKLAKAAVQLWLTYKDGDDFVRMLDGTEAIFVVQENPKMRAIITTLLMLEFDGDGATLTGRLQKEITRVFSDKRFIKLRSAVAQAHGYYYFKRSHCPITNHFKQLAEDADNGPMTLELLRSVISDISNAPMPCNDTALWEVRIGQRQLVGSRKCVYPLVLRFHHVFGDAITLFNMFSGEFQNGYPLNSVKVACVEELRSLDATFTQSPFISMCGLIDKPDNNVLCQANGRKHVVWYTEAKPQLLSTIKQIKTQLNNDVTVVDIILTCFLETLDNYLSKTYASPEAYPNSIFTVLPMMPPKVQFTAYGALSNYKFNNKFSLGFLRVPLKLDTKQCQCRLLKRLELIRLEYDVFKNKSLDLMCNRWQGKVLLTVLPRFLFKWLVEKYGVSLMVSNIPGCNTLKCFGGLKVKEFVVIDPNASISGVTLMITSYEERLSFSYTIDTEIIANVDDVTDISANFIHNINKLRDIVNVPT